MDLAQGNQRPALASVCNAELFQEERAVAFDGGMRILFSEAQIQRLAP